MPSYALRSRFCCVVVFKQALRLFMRPPWDTTGRQQGGQAGLSGILSLFSYVFCAECFTDHGGGASSKHPCSAAQGQPVPHSGRGNEGGGRGELIIRLYIIRSSQCTPSFLQMQRMPMHCYHQPLYTQSTHAKHIPMTRLYAFLPPLAVGLLYIQMAQKPTNPVTVAAMPDSQGQAPEMTKLRGHSSCAMCRTLTVRFSSTYVTSGRL